MLTPRINVLVLDDEPSCAKTMRLFLEDRGYQVQSFTDPPLAIVAAVSKTFQIAFVNYSMPELNGDKVVEHLKAIDKRIYTIIHTAYSFLDLAILAMRAGADDFLPVPWREEELFAAVGSGIQRLGLKYTSEMEFHRIVGQRVRDARVDQDLTLDDVSNRSGLASSELQELEDGMVTPSIAVLARIAGALRLRIADLLWGL